MNIRNEILEYFSYLKKSNMCFPKFFLCKGKNISEEKPDSSNIFPDCGKKEGIQVWIINSQNKSPILMENHPDSYQNLNSGNNYIFLKTYKKLFYHKGALILKPKFFYEIYYWIGNNSHIKINFSVSYHTTLLSYQLNISNIFREEYNNESIAFKKNCFQNR
jgi:hypothetical protein